MRISAVICTYNRYDLLGDAIFSLAAQDYPKSEYEILVIDNSPDAQRSRIERAKYASLPGVIWHYEDKAGLSNARNVATAMAKGDIIVFIDDDAIAAPGWCRAYDEAFRFFDESVGIIGGKVSPKFLGTRPDWLSEKLLGHLSMVNLGNTRRLITANEWVVGANVAYRANVLRSAGGFSTNLGRVGSAGLLSSEETDIANRLAAAGYKTGYDPDAAVLHVVDESRTNQAWFARRFAWQAVSAVLSNQVGDKAQVELAERAIMKYFAALHPADRHIGALLSQKDTAGELDWQLGTIYNLVLLLLCGERPQKPDGMN